MFIFYFMCAYIFMVFFVAILHAFLGPYLKKYDKYIEKDKNIGKEFMRDVRLKIIII